MADRVRTCPYCGAPLHPSRFARIATCEYCNSAVHLDEQVISASRFREAHREWVDSGRDGDRSWLAVGRDHWAPIRLLAHGEFSDVFLADRGRRPTERALLKLLRNGDDLPVLEREWTALQELQASTAPGADALAARLPQPIDRGEVRSGDRAGAHALVLRWAPGFEHTFEAIRTAFPRGVSARVSIWMWRRLLETLAFVHRSGFVHGAVLPQHLLVERGEHGLRLVGYGCAGHVGEALTAVVTRYEGFYPAAMLAEQRLSPEHDLAMSARCVAYALGADDGTNLPASVPATLRDLVRAVGRGEDSGEAWDLRQRVGVVGRELFGAASFHPLTMPGDRAR